MDLSSISTEELYAEINKRNMMDSIAPYKIKFIEIANNNNCDVFVLKEDFINMTLNGNEEIVEDAITLYDETVPIGANGRKLYFYSSFRDMILDNVSPDDILREVTNENKEVDLSNIKQWGGFEYVTVRLNDGKEAYLVL